MTLLTDCLRKVLLRPLPRVLISKVMACNIFLKFYNGVKLPALGLGTWQAENQECEKAIEEALKAGYRYIDTAFDYGNEYPIGKILSKWISKGKLKREDIFISTKLHMAYTHPERVEEAIKKSLDNLQIDYVDLYLMHCPCSAKYEDFVREGKIVMDHSTDIEKVWKEMEKQVKLGRAKNIGVSNFNINQLERIIKTASIKPVNNQIELHLYMQQDEIVNFCSKNEITVVAYSPLGSPGFNKYMGDVGKTPKELPNIFGNPTVLEIAEKHKKTPAQVILRFIIQIGVCPIPKSVNPKRMRENIDIFDFELDECDMMNLKKLNVGSGARICDWSEYDGFFDHPECPFK